MKLSFGHIKYLNSKFAYACLIIDKKGYKVSSLWQFDPIKYYEEYLECPLMFVRFPRFEYLPSVPNGFELNHIMDEKYSLLSYLYENGLSRKKILAKMDEAAEEFYVWALKLPRRVVR